MNLLKKINPFDFNFKDQTEIKSYSGCNICHSETTPTSLQIVIENDSFSIEIDGLTPSWSYKARYTVLD